MTIIHYLVFYTLAGLSIVTDAKNYIPAGPYDIAPKEIDKLCQIVDPEYTPLKAEDPCVFMKWISCPPGQGSGKPNEPCGWYQQTVCPDEPASNSLRRRRQFDQRRLKLRHNWQPPLHQQSFVSISWPKKNEY